MIKINTLSQKDLEPVYHIPPIVRGGHLGRVNAIVTPSLERRCHRTTINTQDTQNIEQYNFHLLRSVIVL